MVPMVLAGVVHNWAYLTRAPFTYYCYNWRWITSASAYVLGRPTQSTVPENVDGLLVYFWLLPFSRSDLLSWNKQNWALAVVSTFSILNWSFLHVLSSEFAWGYINLISLSQNQAIFIFRLAWKWLSELHCRTANLNCPALEINYGYW